MTTAERLRKARQELDECAAWLERIAKDVETEEARQRPCPELVGAKEAAEILGLQAPAFAQRRNRGMLPEPVAELHQGFIWLRRDIEQLRAVAA